MITANLIASDVNDGVFMKLTRVTTDSPVQVFSENTLPMNCIEIEHSIFSDSSDFSSIPLVNFNLMGSANNTFVQVKLHNVTLANITEHPVAYLRNVAMLFVNCTFENNAQSAIHASESTLIFEGNNLFKNNSALVGGGIQLLDSSDMYLRPNTSILFESNHADYVGGAIYTDYRDQFPCFFQYNICNNLPSQARNFPSALLLLVCLGLFVPISILLTAAH